MGAIHAPPFLFVPPNGQQSFGSEVMLIKTIAEKLDLTVNFHYYSNMDNLGNLFVSQAGYINGSGMVNELLLNEIDIAIGNILISDIATENLAVSTSYTVVWIHMNFL